ncbi:MAG: o-succinylbenzoate synthase [Marinifilaceae bacterium]|jgi:o-succinylbenzoate synthase|nr:o-succinylbenzoate synthase [Marinifilaceae bacterium]
MYTAEFKYHKLIFKFNAGTSRGILKTKDSWFLKIKNESVEGIGEVSIIPKLSIDFNSGIEQKLAEVCKNINYYIDNLDNELFDYPSIKFAIETAILDIKNGGRKIIFDNNFSRGLDSIDINGLIWMGDRDFMLDQIKTKIKESYKCIKLKIGALDFDTEYKLLEYIREQLPNIELRVDANGAYDKNKALFVLEKLKNLGIHSIEQPIKQGQIKDMADLCISPKTDIVLDEELIGIHDYVSKENLLISIKPQYIILKPSLIGGFKSSEEWIEIAERNDIKWWITSALESNIGLNAIAQWTYNMESKLAQGLGTGMLYENNISSPLCIRSGKLYYDNNLEWGEL